MQPTSPVLLTYGETVGIAVSVVVFVLITYGIYLAFEKAAIDKAIATAAVDVGADSVGGLSTVAHAPAENENAPLLQTQA